MTGQVFLSYRFLDSLVLDRLEIALTGRGYRIWRDIRNVATGKSWIDEIDRGLETSDFILAGVTPSSLFSRNVRNEWMWAKEHKKSLIFIAWEPIDWFPPELAEFPVVDFTSAYKLYRDSNTDRVIDLKVHVDQELEAFRVLDDLLQGKFSQNTKQFIEQAINFHNPEIMEKYRESKINFPVDWRSLQDLRRYVWDQVNASTPIIDSFVNSPYVAVGAFSLHSNKPLIQEVERLFDQSDGRLAVAGRLGSGKTTILRSLIKSLLLSARDDPSAPVPVWLPVSNLAYGNSTIDLFAQNIQSLYGIDSHLAHTWLESGAIAVIVDGIDDVYNYDFIRDRIFDALLHYKHQVPGFRFAISIQAQEQIPADLEICSVTLLPLTDEMIEDYVREFPNLEELRAALHSSPTLRESARTIFSLQAMKGAYKSLSRLKILNAGTDPASYEYQTIQGYIAAQLQIHAPEYTLENATRWLGVLASEMKGLGEYFGGTVLWGLMLRPSIYWLTPVEKRLYITITVLASTFMAYLLSFSFLLPYDLVLKHYVFRNSLTQLLLAAGLAVFLGVLLSWVINRLMKMMTEAFGKPDAGLALTNEGRLARFAQTQFRAQENAYAGAYGSRSFHADAFRNIFVEERGARVMSAMSMRSHSLFENFRMENLVKWTIFTVTAVLMSTYLVLENPYMSQSALTWTLGGIVLLQALPTFWSFLKKILAKKKEATKSQNLLQIFLGELLITSLLGFSVAILIGVFKFDRWYLLCGVFPAFVQFVIALVTWARLPEVERKREPGNIYVDLLNVFVNGLRGTLFGIPGFFSFPTANWLTTRLEKQLTKLLYATGRFPPNAYNFIKSMEQCGFVQLVDDQYCVFVHPLLQRYFEEHQ